MGTDRLLTLFKEKQALLTGHFLLSSGKHSPDYFQCALLLQFPDVAAGLARHLARLVVLPVDVVVSPAMGGIVIGHEVGRALKVRAVFAERVDGVVTLRRGFALARNERVLIVEDVVTTGRSSAEVCVAVRAAGAVPTGVACLVNRTTGTLPFDLPVFSLLTLPMTVHDALTCPLCAAGAPLVKPGSRKESLPQ